MRFWISIEVLLGLICCGFSKVPLCPPEEDIYPCKCINNPFDVHCQGISGIDTIKHVLKNTKGSTRLSFWESKLGNIPSDFFNGTQYIDLTFDNSEIVSFGDRPFTGLEDTLKTLHIYASIHKRRKDLETFPLSHLKKLEVLTFRGNDITRVGNEWFESGPSALREIGLASNNIEDTGYQAFASLVNLERIVLSDNKIENVYRTMFPRPAPKLRRIEMNINEIDMLPEDMFEGMPALREIHLSGNKLKTIPEATWGKIWNQLDEIHLDHNRGFKCDENTEWILKKKVPKRVLRICEIDIINIPH